MQTSKRSREKEAARRLWDPSVSKRTRTWIQIREALSGLADVQVSTMSVAEWKEHTCCPSGADGVREITLLNGLKFPQLCEQLQVKIQHNGNVEKFYRKYFTRYGLVSNLKEWHESHLFRFRVEIYLQTFHSDAGKRERNLKRWANVHVVETKRLTWRRIKKGLAAMVSQGKLGLSTDSDDIIRGVTLLGELKFEAFCEELVHIVHCEAPPNLFKRVRQFFMANGLYPPGGIPLSAWIEGQTFTITTFNPVIRKQKMAWPHAVRALEHMASQQKLLLRVDAAQVIRGVTLLGDLKFGDMCPELVKLTPCIPPADPFLRVRTFFMANGLVPSSGNPRKGKILSTWLTSQSFEVVGAE